MFTVTTTTLATGLEFGGDLRVWWKLDNEQNNFFFDRLSLTFKSALSAQNGFKGEIRFCQVDKNGSNSGDIRVYNAYYYQTKFFVNDELNVGYFNVPFDYDKVISLVFTPSYNHVWIKQGLGVKYAIQTDKLQFAAAITNRQNWKNDNSYIDADGNKRYYEGYDFSLRMVYSPSKEFSVGFGYIKDNLSNENDTYNQNYVVDAIFTKGPFGIFTEYTQKKPSDAEGASGSYLEAWYQLSDQITAYAGSSIDIDDLSTATTTAKNNTFLGVKFQIAAKTAIQAEYVDFTDDDTYNLNVRLRVEF
jgi:hypothetical protein